jgi:CcmD family protein
MNYLIAAYSAIWILLFFFLFSLFSRLKNLEKTLDTLRRKLAEKTGA